MMRRKPDFSAIPVPEPRTLLGRAVSHFGRAWLFTFTDLLLLLLTFFVMLFMMGAPNEGKFRELVSGLSAPLGSPRERPMPPARSLAANISFETPVEGINLRYLAALLQSQIDGASGMPEVTFTLQGPRLVISLPGDLLFPPGGAEPGERGNAALAVIGGTLARLDNEIVVYGHADPRAPSGGLYTSNWDLSLARAASVADALRREGYRRRVTPFGLGDSRFSDLPEEMDETARFDMARRVDIVILAESGEAE
jgi:chemotaxis protein MotB